MTTLSQLTRRDQCATIGERAARLTNPQAIRAWHILAKYLQDDLCEKDIPKFKDLLTAIRSATIGAKSPLAPHPSPIDLIAPELEQLAQSIPSPGGEGQGEGVLHKIP